MEGFESLQGIGLRVSGSYKLLSKGCLKSSSHNRGSLLGFEPLLIAAMGKQNKNNPNIRQWTHTSMYIYMVEYHTAVKMNAPRGRPSTGWPPRHKILQRKQSAEEYQHYSTMFMKFQTWLTQPTHHLGVLQMWQNWKEKRTHDYSEVGTVVLSGGSWGQVDGGGFNMVVTFDFISLLVVKSLVYTLDI